MSNRNLSDLQFKYQKNEDLHSIDAIKDNRNLGFIEWHTDTGNIKNIKVNHDIKRQGIGTKLWEQANKIAQEKEIVAPKHVAERTKEGDAWAKAVGGALPKKKPSHYGP